MIDSSSITSIKNNTVKVYSERAEETKGSNELDQNAFLQLLMTQLQHQDPMSPMDTKDFMSQQAQFTQISELQKLNSNISSSNSIMQASSLIGKEVNVVDPDDPSKTIEGVVSEAKFNETGAYIMIGDVGYPLELVSSIKNPTSTTTTE